jgi:acetolactate decarboxylase
MSTERTSASAGLALAAAAVGCRAPAPQAPAAPPLAALVNASVRASYIAGGYDGFIPAGELRAHGDFGLGAADRNDGELVALDGAYYRARGDGSVVPVRDDELVPFATVVQFRPDRKLHITGPMPRAAFEARLDEWLPGPNRIFAIRVHGRFTRIVAGASAAQSRPYPSIAELWPKYNFISRDDLVGTLAGFRIPGVLRDLSKQGYHFHLLSDDHLAGGHVEDETIADVEVEAQELHRVDLILPSTDTFQATNLILQPPK